MSGGEAPDESGPDRGVDPATWRRLMVYGRGRVACAHGVCGDDVDDVLQDALVALIEAVDARQDETPLFGFLKSALEFHCLLDLRRRRRRSATISVDALHDAASPDPGPTESQLEDLLVNAPENLRPWLAAFMSAVRPEELAAEHGVSPVTVRWWAFQVARWLLGEGSKNPRRRQSNKKGVRDT